MQFICVEIWEESFGTLAEGLIPRRSPRHGGVGNSGCAIDLFSFTRLVRLAEELCRRGQHHSLSDVFVHLTFGCCIPGSGAKMNACNSVQALTVGRMNSFEGYMKPNSCSPDVSSSLSCCRPVLCFLLFRDVGASYHSPSFSPSYLGS